MSICYGKATMRGKLYYTGHSFGWSWALTYVTGTKSERAEIRRTLRRMAECWSEFALGVYDGFEELANPRSASILAGRAPRTVNPHKPAHVLDRVAWGGGVDVTMTAEMRPRETGAFSCVKGVGNPDVVSLRTSGNGNGTMSMPSQLPGHFLLPDSPVR